MRFLQSPLALVARVSRAWPAIERDMRRCVQPRLDLPLPPARRGDLLRACRHKPFRTILYARMRSTGRTGRVAQRLLRIAYPGQVALEIHCPDIGPGLYMMHG